MLLFFCRGYFVGGESNRGGYSVGGESNRISQWAALHRRARSMWRHRETVEAVIFVFKNVSLAKTNERQERCELWCVVFGVGFCLFRCCGVLRAHFSLRFSFAYIVLWFCVFPRCDYVFFVCIMTVSPGVIPCVLCALWLDFVSLLQQFVSAVGLLLLMVLWRRFWFVVLFEWV